MTELLRHGSLHDCIANKAFWTTLSLTDKLKVGASANRRYEQLRKDG
jgi:hypothetical protein